MTRIYLIRHAESIANTKGVYQGQSYDSPLSPLGLKQAERLGQRLQKFSLDAIYASPLKRTIQTAEMIQRFQRVPVDIVHVDTLKEISHGEWEGKTKNEIQARWPDLYRLWQQEPHHVAFPRGESLMDVEQRILAWFRKITGVDKTVAVVTHVAVIQTLLCHIHRIPLADFWKMPHASSASVTLIESRSPVRITIHNDTSHLVDLASDLSKQAL